MEIGTGLFTCQRRPDDDRTGAAVYEEMLTVARAADRAGLDSVWVSEHHFQADDYLSATMPALGAIAAETEAIEVGTMIALAPLYDPVRLAEDAATVDLIADGRLTLGLAIGSNPREFDAFGVPRDERVERLVDTLGVLRSAWSPGPVEYDSDFHAIGPDHGVSVTPRPDGSIPVLLGGAARPAVRRAARRAEGWCAPSSLSVEGVGVRHDDIRRVRAEEGVAGGDADADGTGGDDTDADGTGGDDTGGDGTDADGTGGGTGDGSAADGESDEFTTYVIQHGFVADSREEAWERMREGYLYIQRRYAEIFDGEPVEELPGERRAELKEQAIFGTPDQVAAELETYRDRLGDDIHFVFRTYHPGIGTDAMVECVERLGEEVAPRFR